MFRWPGSQQESDKQSGDRAARAARRTLASLPSPVNSDSDSELYAECETTIGGQLDGDDDLEVTNATMPDEVAPVPFDTEDKANDADSWKKELRIKFDPHDVEYYFNAIEAQMKSFGINRQWDKKNAILPMLPENIIVEFLFNFRGS